MRPVMEPASASPGCAQLYARMLLEAWERSDSRALQSAVQHISATMDASLLPDEMERFEIIHEVGRFMGECMQARLSSGDVTVGIHLLRHFASSPQITSST